MFYPHIKKGGYLLVDDCAIPTIGRMADILAEDEMWDFVELVGSNTAVFKRSRTDTLDPEGDGWWTQSYNRRRVSRRRDIWLGDQEPSDVITDLKLDKALHGEQTLPQPTYEQNKHMTTGGSLINDNSSYEELTSQFFGEALTRDLRNAKLHSIYRSGTGWFDRCFNDLLAVEHDYIQALISQIGSQGISGSLVEFGIFQGAWINRLHEMAERAGLLDREIWGFDSFQGLSSPHPDFDTSYWKEGMYSAPKQQVEANVRAHERPRVKLVEGFFSDSLVAPPATTLGEVAFARIDCDIYEPALECLHFLSSRLAHGSILVFDDWTHDFAVGEGRAFAEWVSTVPHLSFKFLFLGPWDHLHLRVLHKDKDGGSFLEPMEDEG
jgi:hypothetical protein